MKMGKNKKTPGTCVPGVLWLQKFESLVSQKFAFPKKQKLVSLELDYLTSLLKRVNKL